VDDVQEAKRFARTFTAKSGEETDLAYSEDCYCMWRGWHCRNDSRDPDKLRHRCETIDTKMHRIKVVKWVDRAA
jgi:hypothetical protein